MRTTVRLALLVFTQSIWKAIAFQHKIGILADVQLGFPETDKLAAVAVMACRHIQNRDMRLVSAKVSADFNVTCDIVDHSFPNKLQVSEAALHWSEVGTNFMVGAYSSSNTGLLAVIGGLYEIPTVGFWAASESLSDKQAYSHFGRTNPSAGIFPRAILKFISAMGWSNFGYIYHDDANGNAFSTAFHRYAREDNVTVLSSQQYNRGDIESIRRAVKSLAASGATIFTVAAASTDTTMILDAADEEGIIGRGYTWFGAIGQPGTVLAQSKNATRTLEIVSGWIAIESDPFADERRWERFDNVWKGESFEDIEIADVNGVVRRPLPATVNDDDCFTICGYMYDAVWTAALVLDETAKEESGEVKARELLPTWNALEFDGATGHVAFDSKRDRGPGVPLVIVNWVPTETGAGLQLVPTQIGHWEQGAAQVQLYSFPDDSAPAWPGGGRGWGAVPGDGSACKGGEVFSLASLRCELCPAGAFQNGSHCSLCPRGFHAPHQGTRQCLPCLQSGYAEREGMAACTACGGNYQMRGGAEAAESEAECVCQSGFLFHCRWPVWQLVVVIAAGLVVVKLLEVGARRVRAKHHRETEVGERVNLLRTLLRLRREDGFRVAGERESWLQWAGVAKRARLLRAKPLKHLALLTLLRRFEVEEVDSLGVLLQALAGEAEAATEAETSSLDDSLRLDLPPASQPSLLPHGADGSRWARLCNILIHVSCQLLDPHGMSSKAGGSAHSEGFLRTDSNTSSHHLWLVGVPDTQDAEDRFLFFRDHVAKLGVWEGGEAFAGLKRRLQLVVDALRSEMDLLYAAIVTDEGGPDLVAWNPKVQYEEEGGGAIQRQDHPRVLAIRVDDHARKKMALLKEGGGGGGGPSAFAASGSMSGAGSGDVRGLERQFVEELHLQASLLDASFQLKVHHTLASRPALLPKPPSDLPALHTDPSPDVQVSAGAIKTVKRMLEKVKSYAEEARCGKAALAEPYTAHILDPVRASLICKDSKQLLQTAQWLVEHGRECGLPVLRVKNKFAVKDSSEYDGYRDLMLSVVHTGPLGLRIVGELQLHDRRMHPLKVKMHRLYKVRRATSAATI